MFKVMSIYEDASEYTVYAVQRNDKNTAFLLWRNGHWLWDDASYYIPVN